MKGLYDFGVRVNCMTYNHAPYIVDAMNGFTMQQTNFPFVCTIIDDDSIDGEQRVIEQYLDNHFDLNDKNVFRYEDNEDYILRFARHKVNYNCFFAVILLKYNHYSIGKSKNPYLKEWLNIKYVSLCEGDDYWIHPHKLQMQYDLLENDSKIGLCYTKSYEIAVGESVYRNKILANSKPTDFESMLLHEAKITHTAFYRSELRKRYEEEFPLKIRVNWKMGDTPLWLWMTLNSMISALDEITAVSRILPESASHSKNVEKLLAFRKSYMEIRLFFIEKYGKGEILKKQVLDSYYKEVMNIAYNFSQPNLYFSSLNKLNNRSWSDWIKGGKLIIKYLMPRKE